jgi:subtilisin family serine protease
MRFLFSAFIAALLVLSGCSVETQKGRENFDSGRLNTELEKLANQRMELRPLQAQIAARMQADAADYTLPVAIIDNGVDLAHPDLVGRFVYKIEDGKIVGAGHDFMGDDEFASSSLINPTLWAFTATEIKDGVIVSSGKNPLAEMMTFDKEVTSLFLQSLAQDPVLSKSLFAKLSPKNVNVFGLYRLTSDTNSKKLFDPAVFASNKTEGMLMGPDFREKAAAKEALAASFNIYEVYSILDAPWNKMRTPGGPYAFGVLNKMENADLVVELAKKTIASYPRFAELKAGIDHLVEFKLHRDHSLAVDMEEQVRSACGDLSTALEFVKGGITAQDPIVDLSDTFIATVLSAADISRVKTEFPAILPNKSTASDAINESYNRIELYKAIVNEVKQSAQERFALRRFNVALAKNKALMTEFLKVRGGELDRLFDADFHSNMTSEYRRMAYRSKHPFLSGFGESESHGTHVSGIIAKQNPRLRIYPVRVTTRSAMITKAAQEKLAAQFKGEFKKWLAEPVVARAIYAKLPTLYGKAAEPTNTEEREKFATQLMTVLEEAIDMDFEAGSLDYIFFDEVKQALKHVADQKLKLANISLGAELKAEIPRFSEIDPTKDLLKVYKFLYFEHVKYEMGRVLSTDAKNTLFVVAAGNSATWVDGKSHSALPVDVTSPFLAPFETETMQAPNNHLSNVLGVGSLNPDEDLSGYSNVLLGMKTPIVFAVGEDILSPVRMTDPAPAISYMEKKIENVEPPVGASDIRFFDRLKTREPFTKLGTDDEAKQKADLYFGEAFSVVVNSVDVLKSYLAIQYSDHREHYSGTSMATPAIVGYMGDMILKRAMATGISKDAIYDDPSMTPAALIAELESHGTPLFPGTTLPYKKIDVRGKYERGDSMQALDKRLAEILAPAVVTKY